MMVAMALAPHSVGLWLMLLLSAVVSAEKLLTRAVYHLGLVATVLAFAAIVTASGALGKRRRLLNYLQRSDLDRYRELISELGLRR